MMGIALERNPESCLCMIEEQIGIWVCRTQSLTPEVLKNKGKDIFYTSVNYYL